MPVVVLQGIKGVRFKRVIMDDSAEDRSPNPPAEESFKRLVLCSGKVCMLEAAVPELIPCIWPEESWPFPDLLQLYSSSPCK